MEQENEELEMQNNSKNVFDNFVNGIEEHPKEAGGIIFSWQPWELLILFNGEKDGKNKNVMKK